jgi:hypothetical protein
MKPINKQASLFLTRHRRCETVQEALNGAVNHIISGKINEQLAQVFSGSFGPEPWVTFQFTIRRDPQAPGTFAYHSNTKVGHDIGESIRFFGLKP